MEDKKMCKKCKEPINKAAKKCPNCGANQGMPKWVIAIIVIVVIGVIASASGGNDTAKEGESTSKPKTEKFTYTVDNQYVGDYGMGYYIEGTVKNNKDKDYSYVSIEFVCYDSEGNNLGTALDNTNNLLGNQTWKYKAMFMGSTDEEVDHCDFHEISSY